jgi:hypothetical protein
MSEATETILSAARERIAVLEAEIAEFEAEGRREESVGTRTSIVEKTLSEGGFELHLDNKWTVVS